MEGNQLGQIITGAYGPGNLPTDILKYDKDRAGMLLWRKKGTTKFMSMIHKRFGKRDVKSFRPYWWDMDELDYVFTVKADQDVSTQEGFRTITMTNDQGLQLQPGDLLSAARLFASDGYNGGTPGAYSRVYSDTYRMEEQLLVTSVVEPDSAGSGLAKVMVRRAYFNSILNNAPVPEPATSAAGQLLENDVLLFMGNVHWTGSDAPFGKTKNIEVDSNPLQIMRWAYESQLETSMEETFLQEKPIDINQKLALNNLAFQMEFRALFNRPVIEQRNGKWRFAMGGIFDYVKKTVNYNSNTWDWYTFQQNVMGPIFELGGSSQKVAFTSIPTFTAITTMLWSKVILTINQSWSNEFGFEVYRLTGGGGELNIIPSWVYSRNPHRANQMLVLDFGGPNFKIDVMEDLHVNRDIQAKGQRIEKHEYVTIMGMQRRNPNVHAVVDGLPA